MASSKVLSPKSLFRKFSKSKQTQKSTFEEKFQYIGKNMVIYKDALKIKMKTNQWHTAYGLLNISSSSEQNIFKWTLKITRKITTPKMCIGISSKIDDVNNAFHQKYDRFFYGLLTKDGTKVSIFDRNPQYYCPPCKHHDTIIMELNVSTKTLKYCINGKDENIAFNNIDLRQSYCLAVAVFGNDSKVELIAFEKLKQNFDNEQKDQYIEKEYAIKDEHKENEIENNISLKERNDKLLKNNTELCDNIDAINTKLLERTQEKKKQQQEMDNLELIVSKLTEENKEMEHEHLILQNKINMLRLQKLDEINYAQWSTSQLVYWIVHINYNMFKQYEESLTKILNEEQIDGSCLKDIELEDIQTWNINVIEHRNHIYNNIELMIHKQIENDGYIDMNTSGQNTQNETEYIGKIVADEFDNLIQAELPCESKENEIMSSKLSYNMDIGNGNDSLDNISNVGDIAAVANDKLDELEVPGQLEKFDSLDVMQQKYLMEEINDKEPELYMNENNMITPQ